MVSRDTGQWERLPLIFLVVFSVAVEARRDDNEDAVTNLPISKPEAVELLHLELDTVSSFSLPPRSVNDILAVLERHERDVTPSQQRLFDIVNQSAPDGSDALAAFLGRRAIANRDLGRYRQGIADATAALAAQSPEIRRNAYLQLNMLYGELGYYDEALEYAEQGLKLSSTPAHEFLPYLLLAVNFAYLGHLEESARAIGKLEAISLTRRDFGEWVNWYRSLVLAARGYHLFYTGKYADAISAFSEGASLNERDLDNGVTAIGPNGHSLEDNNQRSRAHLLRYVALSLSRQGRIAEAESLAREIVTDQARYFGTYSGQTAEGLGTLTEVLAEQGRSEDTARLASATLKIYDRMGAEPDSLTRAVVHRALGDALVASKKWDEALAEYQSIERDLADPEKVLLLLQFNLTWAIPNIESGDAKVTLRRLSSISERLAKNVGSDSYEAAEAEGFAASANLVSGNIAQAFAAFEHSVPILLSRTNRSDSEEQSSSSRLLRLRFILEHYIDSLMHRGQPTDVDRAFRIANAIRSSRVDEALAVAAARAALSDLKLADLARDEQNVLAQIKAFNGLLARSGARGPTDRQLRERLLGQIKTLKLNRESILKTIAKLSPEYVRLIDPQPADVADARAALRPDEALIATYTARDRTYVWVVRKTGATSHALIDLPKAELESIILRLREALAPDVSTLGELPAFDTALAYELFRRLLKPVEVAWNDAASLVVVPHGLLASLPLAVLPTQAPLSVARGSTPFETYRDVSWLVRSHTLTTLPSVSSLIALRSAPSARQASKPFLGFGDPVFDPNDSAARAVTPAFTAAVRSAPKTRAIDSAKLSALPRLPETAEELLAIAKAVGADPVRDVFLRADANEARVKGLSAEGTLSEYRVVSFATHGLVPGDLDGLTQPALALSSPLVAKVEGAGLLDVAEILALKLNADWAVLSACNTASADGDGAEAMSGLGRAFFYAGTRALLVSNWPVHSAATTYLMTNLFRRYATGSRSRAQALREAMLQTMDEGGYQENGEMVFSYAHPLFWAPFSLVGDGGG